MNISSFDLDLYQSNFKMRVISPREAGRNQVSYSVVNCNLKFNEYIRNKNNQ
ncbi:hypothetical protein Xind_00141 [Xenorhabdus indica]|nr:hypothetical protein [Xenorhabdus indica]